MLFFEPLFESFFQIESASLSTPRRMRQGKRKRLKGLPFKRIVAKIVLHTQTGKRRVLFLGFKFIANAPHCFERPLIADTFQFFPQALDVHINGARVAVIIKAPHFVEQLVAGENAVWIAGEMIDQLKEHNIRR